MLQVTVETDCDWEFSPESPSITEELLTVEVELEVIPDSSSASKSQDCDEHKFLKIWQSIIASDIYVLSEFGKEKLEKLVKQFSLSNKKDPVVKFYSHHCLVSTTFFDGNPSQEDANKNLLHIIKIIIDSTSTEFSQSQVCTITQFEREAIEFLGGFVLFKANSKFPLASSIIKIMSQQMPEGKLIKAIEKNEGALFYPHAKFISLLNTVYFKCSREVQKSANQIDFSNVSSTILLHTHYESYLEEILGDEVTLEDEIPEELIRKLLKYTILLFVRMLSYTFAKRLFYKLYQQSSKGKKSLRHSLQPSTSSQ